MGVWVLAASGVLLAAAIWKGSDDVASIVKWTAIGGGVYVAGKYLKVL